jgi:hypothetical protein
MGTAPVQHHSNSYDITCTIFIGGLQLNRSCGPYAAPCSHTGTRLRTPQFVGRQPRCNDNEALRPPRVSAMLLLRVQGAETT